MKTIYKNMVCYLKNYLSVVISHKLRLVVAVLSTVFFFVISYFYLFEGMNKKFILFTSLSLLIGISIAFPAPKNKILSLVSTLFYLLLIIKMMFPRIELPTHDMSRIQDGAAFVNILIILAVFAVLLIVSQSLRIAFGLGSLFLLVFFLINYYVDLFRGSGISLNDLLATGTALTVMDNYRLSMDSELWYSILWFCFFIVAGFRYGFPYIKKSLKYHLAITFLGIVYLLSFGYFWQYTDYLDTHDLHGYYWNMSENQQLNGFLLSFAISIKESKAEKPEGYSEQALENIEAQIDSEREEDTEKETTDQETTDQETPNIIIIMNEAWSDLSVLGNLETSEPYMPFYDSLTENTVKGNLHVDVLGGLTANSEFELLTGDTLAFLPSNTIPYQQQVNHNITSLATLLKEQGYATMAMHPSTGNAWNRDSAYSYLGFDDFIDVDKFSTDFEYVRTFISDECNFNEIIYQYEQKAEDTPLFLFDVTIQNHADYYGGIDLPIEVLKIGDTDVEDAGYTYDLQTYLNLIKISDDALKELITYFENVDEPTIICMFGDHEPNLYEDFYTAMENASNLTAEEFLKQKYITPYLIWANYDADLTEYGDMSTNYLGAAVLESAGVTLSPYYEYLLYLHEKYPVISNYGCYTADGTLVNINDIKADTDINTYQILQYNQLIESNFRASLFSIR